MEEELNKLNACFHNRVFDGFLQKESNRYYQIKSSIHVLNNTRNIINQYQNIDFKMINLYGLFQYLFISIDALYDLAYAITNNKWAININNNPKLRDIKYIRNDCIGHPTYRQYGNNKVGFCYIDNENTTKDVLAYDCFLDESDELVKKRIEINPLIENFYAEATNTLKDIYGYIVRDKNVSKIYLSPLLDRIYNSLEKSEHIVDLLDRLRDIYINSYGLEKNSKNRFLWRIDIVKSLLLIETKNNNEYDVVIYLIKKQLKKLISMAIDADFELFSYQAEVKIRPLHEPTMIKYAKEYIKKCGYQDIISDANHPLFDNAISSIINNAPDIVCDLFLMMKREEKNQSFIYALGSALNDEKV